MPVLCSITRRYVDPRIIPGVQHIDMRQTASIILNQTQRLYHTPNVDYGVIGSYRVYNTPT